jgi:tetratricopeptide (TPR) repeat protein
MLKPKKKITKQELKQDKLVTWYFKVSEKFSQYQKQITTGAGILVGVLVLLYFVIIKPAQENKEISKTALSDIMYFYDAKQYDLAISGVPERNVVGLKQIVEEYGSTEAGETAKIYLGNIYFMKMDYQNAKKYFEDYSGKNDIYKVSALSGIASVYEAQKQNKEAAEYFEKAANKASSEILSPENLLNASRNYNLAGNKQKAIELLEKIKKEYPKSAYAKDVERYIAEYEG